MRLLLWLLPSFLSAQTVAFPGPGMPASSGALTISQVAQCHGESATGTSSISANTCTGTASSGGGTTVDIAAHDLIHVTSYIGGGSCYTVPPTVTISDTATTNTFTQLGTGATNGSFWGPPCLRHFWADAAAKSGDLIACAYGSSAFGQYACDITVYRCSTACSAWTNVGHNEKDGGNANSITSASLGNAAALDVIVAGFGMDYQGSPTLSAGTMGDGTGTLATTTEATFSSANIFNVVEYKIQAGSTTGATATGTSNITHAMVMVAALFRPTP